MRREGGGRRASSERNRVSIQWEFFFSSMRKKNVTNVAGMIPEKPNCWNLLRQLGDTERVSGGKVHGGEATTTSHGGVGAI